MVGIGGEEDHSQLGMMPAPSSQRPTRNRQKPTTALGEDAAYKAEDRRGAFQATCLPPTDTQVPAAMQCAWCVTSRSLTWAYSQCKHGYAFVCAH
jgi:hypothetical protein